MQSKKRSSCDHKGNHVWSSNVAKELDGSDIGDRYIVTDGLVVTSLTNPTISLIGGIPTKIIKK